LKLAVERKIGLYFVAGIGLILVIYLAFFTGLFRGSSMFYLVFNHVGGLRLESPVIIQDHKVGKVSDIYFHEDNSGRIIVRINVKNNVNIPGKSFGELIVINPTTLSKGIRLNLIASGDYLEEGDTISTNDLEQLLDSMIDKTNDIENNLEKVLTDTSSLAEYVQSTATVPVREISNTDVVFKVQILVSKKNLPFDSKVFKGIGGIGKYYQNGSYKYTVGGSASLEDILKFNNEIQDLGFKDSFVIAFCKDERISVKEAVKILKK